jgi:phage shock protein PspC (stress-responsive transcriptional regulator)
MKINNATNVIERDIHCPFCDGNGALLISGLTNQTSTIDYPGSAGLKFWLSFACTGGFYMFVKGVPFVSKSRKYEYTTYGFCPHCGNSFNAAPPESIKEENNAPKLRKDLKNKKITGVCAGVAKYTGLPVKLCRATCFFWGYGGFLYLLLAIFLPAEDEEIE